ncbi:MAG: type II toxin-antitoxin system RatA family toxin [Alphaproteobacteria bacterium]
MPTHAEKRVLAFTPKQLFDLVADVDRYPEFLPWCVGARVWKREGNVLHANLIIGYKVFRERFTSRVTLTPPKRDASGLERGGRVDVVYLDGPFRYLNNHWIFEPRGKDDCLIDFFIDFEFHSRFLQMAMHGVFNEAVQYMVRAFEKRAQNLYGANAVVADPA